MEKFHPSQEWMLSVETDLSGSAGELGIKGWSVLCASSLTQCIISVRENKW